MENKNSINPDAYTDTFSKTYTDHLRPCLTPLSGGSEEERQDPVTSTDILRTHKKACTFRHLHKLKEKNTVRGEVCFVIFLLWVHITDCSRTHLRLH